MYYLNYSYIVIDYSINCLFIWAIPSLKLYILQVLITYSIVVCTCKTCLDAFYSTQKDLRPSRQRANNSSPSLFATHNVHANVTHLVFVAFEDLLPSHQCDTE